VPLTLADLDRVLRESSICNRLQPHPAIAGALYLDLHGRQWEITFDPAVADAHPGRIRLLTPGEPLLSDLLDLVLPPAAADSGRGLLRAATGETTRWYAVRGDALAPVESLVHLRAALEDPQEVRRDVHVQRAREDLEAAAGEIRRRNEELEKVRQEERRAELEERGRLVLARAVACQQVLLGTDAIDAAWDAVARAGYPLSPLARLVGQPEDADVRRARARISDTEAAHRQLDVARRDAEQLVRRIPVGSELRVAASRPVDRATVSLFPLM
jgi:hypothetical protein